MTEDKLERKEEKLEKQEEDISQKEKTVIEEIKEHVEKLKSLFYQEAEVLVDKNLEWKDKCRSCAEVVDDENSVLHHIRSDAELVSKLASHSEKVFKEEEVDAYLISRVHPQSPFGVLDAQKLDLAKMSESKINKINLLIGYDLEMMLEDQNMRKKLYLDAVNAELSKDDFLHNQYDRMVKASRYLNEMLRYILGEENLEKYAILVELNISMDLEKETNKD